MSGAWKSEYLKVSKPPHCTASLEPLPRALRPCSFHRRTHISAPGGVPPRRSNSKISSQGHWVPSAVLMPRPTGSNDLKNLSRLPPWPGPCLHVSGGGGLGPDWQVGLLDSGRWGLAAVRALRPAPAVCQLRGVPRRTRVAPLPSPSAACGQETRFPRPPCPPRGLLLLLNKM